ncbi:MAG: HEAT repeat domain-containing protein [Planctomycetes bacterium]|nr:HEAT repeat domain-containing protein [Planctomycetota bacterium]
MTPCRNKEQGDIRTTVAALLLSDDPEQVLDDLQRLPTRSVIQALLALLCEKNDRLRTPAIVAMGKIVSMLAEESMERARTIMRRLMWSLNDESGGIGWGAPEAMAEIMANHKGLADEFAHVLVSFINPAGNYLEYPPLQRGALWGIRRLAEVHPARVQEAAPFLDALQRSQDPQVRDMAALALRTLQKK